MTTIIKNENISRIYQKKHLRALKTKIKNKKLLKDHENSGNGKEKNVTTNFTNSSFSRNYSIRIKLLIYEIKLKFTKQLKLKTN